MYYLKLITQLFAHTFFSYRPLRVRKASAGFVLAVGLVVEGVGLGDTEYDHAPKERFYKLKTTFYKPISTAAFILLLLYLIGLGGAPGGEKLEKGYDN